MNTTLDTTMTASVYTAYGSPDVLQVEEVAIPTPKENEVLVTVCATTISAVDSTFRSGETFSARLFTGILKPTKPTLGSDFAGQIVAVGAGVTLFKVGDEVFGATSELGAHAEYICLPEEGAIAHKPANSTFEEAAAALSGLTALPFLRDNGHIQRGQQVLINGASGGVGAIAVQIAKYYGAEVTGVCSSAKVEFVRSLGADKVIDYTQADFTQSGERYDIIFDVAGKSSFSKCKNVLKQNGIYLSTVVSPGILLQMARTSLIGNKKAVIAFTGLRRAADKAKDLRFLKELIEEGKIRPTVDSIYPLEKIVEAHRYFDQGQKKGNVVMTVG